MGHCISVRELRSIRFDTEYLFNVAKSTTRCVASSLELARKASWSTPHHSFFTMGHFTVEVQALAATHSGRPKSFFSTSTSRLDSLQTRVTSLLSSLRNSFALTFDR